MNTENGLPLSRRNSCPCTGLLPFPWCTRRLHAAGGGSLVCPVYGQAGESGDPCSVCPGLHPGGNGPAGCGSGPGNCEALRPLGKEGIRHREPQPHPGGKYEGKVPCDFAALESLPGVGHKTASVVMVQAFGVPAFPVDTHIFRLSRLWGLSTGKRWKPWNAI